jgi:hypothetical protein
MSPGTSPSTVPPSVESPAAASPTAATSFAKARAVPPPSAPRTCSDTFGSHNDSRRELLEALRASGRDITTLIEIPLESWPNSEQTQVAGVSPQPAQRNCRNPRGASGPFIDLPASSANPSLRAVARHRSGRLEPQLADD